jgi:hypothetical protein
MQVAPINIKSARHCKSRALEHALPLCSACVVIGATVRPYLMKKTIEIFLLPTFMIRIEAKI